MSLVDDKRTHSRTVREFKAKATLVIGKELMMQIHYMHHRVERGTEWSGVLIYNTVTGNVNDPANWIIKAEEVIPMDVGSSGYTEYEIDPTDDFSADKWMDALEQGKKMGHIHTHHTMGTFFSGTDMSELHDNAPKHNYYLSLIVDYKDHDEWKAKIAICGSIKKEGTIITKLKEVTSWFGASGEESDVKMVDEQKDIDEEVPVLYIINCDIELEESIKPFCERAAKLNDEKGVRYATSNFYQPQTIDYTKMEWDVKLQSWVPKEPGKNQNATVGLKFSKEVSSKKTVQSTGMQFQQENTDKDSEEFEKRTENMYAPGKVRPFLAKILAQDSEFDGEIVEIFTGSRQWTSQAMKDLADVIEDNFENNITKYFKIRKCDYIDAHCVAVSIMDILTPYDTMRFHKYVREIMNAYILPEIHLPNGITEELTGITKYELLQD